MLSNLQILCIEYQIYKSKTKNSMFFVGFANLLIEEPISFDIIDLILVLDHSYSRLFFYFNVCQKTTMFYHDTENRNEKSCEPRKPGFLNCIFYTKICVDIPILSYSIN